MAKKPSNISFAEAASIPLVGLTALQVLRAGGVKEGSKVFIPGGAGGIGSIAIQIVSVRSFLCCFFVHHNGKNLHSLLLIGKEDAQGITRLYHSKSRCWY